MTNSNAPLASQAEAFDINEEVQRRIKASPDGEQVLVNYCNKVHDVLFALRDSAADRLPNDTDYQRLSVSMSRFVDLTYALVYETAHGSVRAEKVPNPKNHYPSAELRFNGLIIEQHGVRRPGQFVPESETRTILAKKNRFYPSLFTKISELQEMEISVLITYCIDSTGTVRVFMGVPNENYTGWTRRPFDLLKFLGLDGAAIEVISSDPVVTSPAVKVQTKEEKRKQSNG
jgi:hypothetical protein